MDNTSYTIRVPKRLGRIAAIVGVLALIVAPLAAVATHSFSDVPNSHTFHEDIAWMKASGVTRGCNPPANTQYCPEDDVKRSQMAAFMRRFAQYLGAEDGTPAQADNADTVDGFHASDLSALVFAERDTNLGGVTRTNSGRVDVNSVSFNVPADGVLVVSGRVFINNQSGAARQYALNVELDGSDALPQDWAAVSSFETGTEQNRGNIDFTVAIPISAGSHTVTQEAGPYSGTADFFYNQQALTVAYYPETLASVAVSSAEDRGGDPQGN